MTSKLELDPRLDPRIKAFFAGMPPGAPQPNVASREELLAQELSPRAGHLRPSGRSVRQPWTARTSRHRRA
jgi:hypothetical protein